MSQIQRPDQQIYRLTILIFAVAAFLLTACAPKEIGDVVTAAPAKQTNDNDSGDNRLSELLANQADRLAYNGEILAEHRIVVVAEANGMAMEVNVEVGQEVAAGTALVQIDSTVLEAQREQAIANLDAAQAQLELLLEAASANDIEAAEASLAAAESSYNRARQGPEDQDIRIAQAQLRQAEATTRLAQSAYNEVKTNPRISSMPQSLELERATLQLEAAQAQYEKSTKGAASEDIANAYAQLINARTSLERLKEGPKPAQIRVTEAQVRQAETSLFLAQLALDKATVRAPVDGIVAKVNVSVGSMVGQGGDVVVLLSHEVKVTIPVEEYRLAALILDQPAAIRVDAYPDTLFEGVVTAIAPELDAVTRTVQVTIRPTNDNAKLLRPGMFATVDLIAAGE